MADININVDEHICTPPELLSVSTGFSGGTEIVTFQITFDSIGQWYKDHVDPNTRLVLQYNYQDGNGWHEYVPDLPFQSLTDYPIQIDKNYGYTVVQFRLILYVNGECGDMESNMLQSTYT